MNPLAEIVLHYAHLPQGPWWDAAEDLVIPQRISVTTEIYGRPLSHFAHRADVIRLQILEAEGGIYLDCDTFCLRSLELLRGYPAVMGIEPNVGLCNAVILAEAGSEFIGAWLKK